MNAIVGDNGIINSAVEAKMKNGMAMLEEWLQEEYVGNFENSDKYDEKLDSMVYETTTNKYFQRAANKDMFFLDPSTYKEYFFIEKSALPKEIQNVLIGGDNSLTGKTIYADFTDVYGVTSDLKVYYCEKGYDSWLGAVDTAKETDLNKTVAGSNSGWGDILGITDRDITVSDIKSANGSILINKSGLDLSFLINFANIAKVEFTNCEYDNLKGLGYLEDVTELYFKKDAVIGDYSEVGKLKKLNQLYFVNSTDGEISKCFSKGEKGIGNYDFNNLNYLAISNDDSRTYWKEADENNGTKNNNITTIEPIMSLSETTKSKITNMNISVNNISSLDGLNKFTNLTFLKARNNSIRTLKGIEGLSKLKYLLVQNNLLGKDLEINDNINDETDSLSWIAKIKEKNDKIENYTFENTLDDLYYLNLSNNPDLIWINYIKNCDKLKYLYLSGDSNINLSSLLGLKSKINEFYIECKFDSKYNLSLKDKNTTTLDLTGEEIGKNIFLSLSEYTKLKSLNLKNVKIYEGNETDKKYLDKESLNETINSVLSRLTNIYALGLNGISDLEDISFVKNMIYLNNVDLRGTGVTTGKKSSTNEDIGLELLNSCGNMYSLAIDNSKIDLSKIQDTLNRLGVNKSNRNNYQEGFGGLVGIDGQKSGTGLRCESQEVLQTLSSCEKLERFISNQSPSGGVRYQKGVVDLTNCKKLTLWTEVYLFDVTIKFPSCVEFVTVGPDGSTAYDFSACNSLKSIVNEGCPEAFKSMSTIKNFDSIKELSFDFYGINLSGDEVPRDVGNKWKMLESECVKN